MLIELCVLGGVETSLATSGSSQISENLLVLKWLTLLLILREQQSFASQIAAVKPCKFHNFCYLIPASLVIPWQQIYVCF